MRQLPWKSKITVLYGKYIRRMIDGVVFRDLTRLSAFFRPSSALRAP